MTRTLKLYNVAVRCGVLSTLNDLIDDLDERIKGTSNSRLHPKKQRVEGPLLDASSPSTAQPWLIREKA